MTSHALKAARLAIGVLFAFAAGSKIAAPETAISTLEWFGAPSLLSGWGVGALVVSELILAVSLFSFPSNATIRWVTLLILGLFTVVLAILYFSANPPACGCIGLIRVFQSHQSEALLGISRNLVLMAVLIWDTPAPTWPKTARSNG